ncbi:MAG TPA: prolyl oligopeptidase family serine peptidase [Firmicutes bacterium]|jgi:predicted peptidase|nr:MAG: phospholipase [Peptococcaceae bacterium 1109]HHT73394.1 prolyl oligopeptidase family serine peptidase [Bacillota bacterium]
MSQAKKRFQKTIAKTVSLDYLLYLPKDYDADPEKKWPLMLFLHGAGERGEDLELLKHHGPPRLLEEGKELPFIVASPQCPANSWWNLHVEELGLLLDALEEEYRVDKSRVYLTGLSMGAYGSWHLATIFPKRFAAVVPICGAGLQFFGFPTRVHALRDVPLWVFHGAKDEVVPLRESEILVEELRKVGGNVRFTVYPEAGHDSWTETYANPELYTWLLEQRLPNDRL